MAKSSFTLEQITYGLLVLLVFVLPLNVVAGSCVFVATAVVGLANVLLYGKPKPITLPPKVKYPLIALFILSGISVVMSGDRGASLYNWVWVVGQEAGIFLLMLYYGSKGHRPQFLMKTFLVAAALVAVYGILQYCYGIGVSDTAWTDASAFPELKRRAASTLVNPNILGTFLVTAIAYCVGIFAPLRGGKTRIGLIIIFVLCCACEMFTFSRGNWVALFWVLLTFAAFFYHRALLPLISGCLVVLYLCWNLLSHRILSIFATEDTSVALRWSYLESTLAMIKEHPLGVGWYGYRFAWPEYDFYLQNPDVIMYHCHNLYLNITAELSIIGLGLFLYLLWQFFKLAQHVRRNARLRWVRGIACGYLASLVGILISGLTDYTLFNIQLGMFFWLGNAMILTLYARYEEAE
ncbi:MAG: O-antigen ligase family protein [Acidaminococcaceae bacterium]|nr:O-antigen ligase family protein [Acidaminococcaceae bacterium]